MYRVENMSQRNEISLISMIIRQPQISVRTRVAQHNALSFDVAEHFGLYTYSLCVCRLSNGYVTNNFEDCDSFMR
jgi:hypothetical protein